MGQFASITARIGRAAARAARRRRLGGLGGSEAPCLLRRRRSPPAKYASLIGLAVAAFAVAVAAPGGPSGWPQFRGGPALTGIATGTRLPQRLRVLWTFEGADAIESSAAIAGGDVFVGTRAGLVALELATVKPRWTYKVGSFGVGESSPAVAGGVVYVGDLV